MRKVYKRDILIPVSKNHIGVLLLLVFFLLPGPSMPSGVGPPPGHVPDHVPSHPFLGCFGPPGPHPGPVPTSSDNPDTSLLNLVLLVPVLHDPGVPGPALDHSLY